jgi:Na+(H+)/acetate symporter ActP
MLILALTDFLSLQVQLEFQEPIMPYIVMHWFTCPEVRKIIWILDSFP